MSVDVFEGAGRVIELSKGNVNPLYRQTSHYEAQVQTLLDMRYHDLLGQDEETYRAGIPEIEFTPISGEGLWTPLVIDPRIPIRAVLRRTYVEPHIRLENRLLFVDPDKFQDLEPAPTAPYIAFFTPGNPDYKRETVDGKIQFGKHLRPARLREAATFALVAPLYIEPRPRAINASGTVLVHSPKGYASLNWDTNSTVYRLETGFGSKGLACCLKDSQLMPTVR